MVAEFTVKVTEEDGVLPIHLIHSFIAGVVTLAQRNEHVIDYAVAQLYEATEILDPG